MHSLLYAQCYTAIGVWYSVATSVIISLSIAVSLDAVEDIVLATEGATDSVQLGCEMKGFLRPDEDLLWYKEQKLLIPTEGGTYSVIVKDGTLGAGQDGRNETVASRLSVLSIKHPKVGNSGVYSCKVRGTDAEANILMMVNKPQIKGEKADIYIFAVVRLMYVHV